MDVSKSIFPQFHHFSKNQSSTNSMVIHLPVSFLWPNMCSTMKHTVLCGNQAPCLGIHHLLFLRWSGSVSLHLHYQEPPFRHHTAVKGIFLKFRYNHFIPCSWSEAHMSLNEPARFSVTWFLLNSPAAFHTNPLTPYAAATLASQFLKASCFTDPCICNSFYLEWCPHDYDIFTL